MSLAITTNIAALIAQRNVSRNNSNLSSTLNKLSSGLRINSASDDSSGMIIADSLKSQNLGLGQAIRNANDGVSMLQIADGALQESVDIINTIKQKSIQAASDTQTYETRTAIQNDIDKLLEEYDIISNSTSFNGQNLLTGTFTNKQIQVGAYSNETAFINISSNLSKNIGHTTTSSVFPEDVGEIRMTALNNITGEQISTKEVDLQYNNDPENGLGAVADEINRLTELTDIKAIAVVASQSSVSQGETGNEFTINGITIGNIPVKNGDSNNALVSAINKKKLETGVEASITSEGDLFLKSTDGRAIKVEGVQDPPLKANNLTTLGELKMIKKGFAQFSISRQIEVLEPDPEPNTIYLQSLPTHSSIMYCEDTNHLYEYVEAPLIIWNDAVTAASNRTYNGLTGYLATVTSLEEDNFINTNLYPGYPGNDGVYMGASDSDVEGEWRWKTGPEGLEDGGQGRLFWLGDGSGAAVGGEYSSWNPGRPENLQGNWDGDGSNGTEDEDHGMYFSLDGRWNDIYGYKANNNIHGYIVEYGGMPGDPVILDAEIPIVKKYKQTILEEENKETYCFCDIDVTDYESAQLSMEIADATLECVEKIRSSVGSSQNQLESTISNLSTTQINVSSSESAIRDADFAEESKVYAQMSVLTQTSTFALAQANEIQKEMLQQLLQ